MTEPIAVFLRGINVGGIQIKMDALKVAFAEMGFPGATTILATGNVVITPPEGSDRVALKARFERELSARFAYDAHVLLRDRVQIAALMQAAQTVTVPTGVHLYALLCEGDGLPAELQQLYDTLPHIENEQFHALEEDAFWIVPKGSTLKSAFGDKVLGSKKYKARLTSRNMNTIEKMNILMAG